MKNPLFLALASIILISSANAQTADGATPATDTICDSVGLIGEDRGLCNAYCEAMDCDSISPL